MSAVEVILLIVTSGGKATLANENLLLFKVSATEPVTITSNFSIP